MQGHWIHPSQPNRTSSVRAQTLPNFYNLLQKIASCGWDVGPYLQVFVPCCKKGPIICRKQGAIICCLHILSARGRKSPVGPGLPFVGTVWSRYQQTLRSELLLAFNGVLIFVSEPEGALYGVLIFVSGPEGARVWKGRCRLRRTMEPESARVWEGRCRLRRTVEAESARVWEGRCRLRRTVEPESARVWEGRCRLRRTEEPEGRFVGLRRLDLC